MRWRDVPGVLGERDRLSKGPDWGSGSFVSRNIIIVAIGQWAADHGHLYVAILKDAFNFSTRISPVIGNDEPRVIVWVNMSGKDAEPTARGDQNVKTTLPAHIQVPFDPLERQQGRPIVKHASHFEHVSRQDNNFLPIGRCAGTRGARQSPPIQAGIVPFETLTNAQMGSFPKGGTCVPSARCRCCIACSSSIPPKAPSLSAMRRRGQ